MGNSAIDPTTYEEIDSLSEAAIRERLGRLRLLTSVDFLGNPAALETLEAGWWEWPGEREMIVASVIRFIGTIPVATAKIWSGRARWLGRPDYCPLTKLAQDPTRSQLDRFLANYYMATLCSDMSMLERMILTFDRDRNQDQLEILLVELACVEPRAALWLAGVAGASQAAIAKDGSTRVAWHGSILNSSGFADEARGFLSHLRPGEVRAKHYGAIDKYVADAISLETDRTIPEALELSEADIEITITNFSVGTPIEQFWRPGRLEDFMVMRSMFETDGLPRPTLATMNIVDEVWVPTRFNAATFAKAGVTSPLRIVRGGIEPNPKPRSRPIYSDQVTRYLSVFDWQPRKGWKYLIEAWARAFSKDDRVELIMKVSRFGVGESKEDRDRLSVELYGEIDGYLSSLGVDRADLAPIILETGALAPDTLLELYYSCDVFVLATCGEGWGRPYMQAMAIGMPTVATNWSGQTEFMDRENSLLIDLAELQDADPDISGGTFSGQKWAKPDVGHLVELLRTLHFNRELGREIAAKAASDIAEKWAWSRIVQEAEDRLTSIEEVLRQESAIRKSVERETEDRPFIKWKAEFFGSGSLVKVDLSLIDRYLKARANLDFVVSIDHVGPIRRNPRRTIEELGGSLAELRPERDTSDLEIRHSWPPDFSAPAASKLAVIFPWEFHQVPSRWVARMNRHVDRVITPSNWTKSILIEAGVDPERVGVVPNGIDPDVYTPEGEKLSLGTDKAHRFLFVGGLIFRKGFDVLLETYCESFTSEDDVALVIKAGELDGVYAFNSMVAKLKEAMARPNCPEIILVQGNLSETEMASLYRSCDTLIHPYRGEGFGMPILEAVACGLPVVVPNYGPAVEYVHADSTLWIQGSGLTSVWERSGASEIELLQLDEPERDSVRRAMLEAIRIGADLRRRAIINADRTSRTHSWGSIFDTFAGEIDAVLALPVTAAGVTLADENSTTFVISPENGSDWPLRLRDSLLCTTKDKGASIRIDLKTGGYVTKEAVQGIAKLISDQHPSECDLTRLTFDIGA